MCHKQEFNNAFEQYISICIDITKDITKLTASSKEQVKGFTCIMKAKKVLKENVIILHVKTLTLWFTCGEKRHFSW